MHGSCKIALYMVLLGDVDGDILLLPVGVRHVKNSRTWLPTLLYSLLRRIAFKAITFWIWTLRAIFIAVNVCSGKIHVYDLRKFNLETYCKKLEVDIMIPSLVSEGQVSRWQRNKTITVTFSLEVGDILQIKRPWGKLPPVSGERLNYDVIIRHIYVLHVIGGCKYVHWIQKLHFHTCLWYIYRCKTVMGKSKSWFDLNHDWITHNDLIWRIMIWFGKRVIWLGFDLKFCDLIWNHSKSQFFP